MFLARGVTEGRGAVGIAFLVEEAFEFAAVVRLVPGGALEQRAQGGRMVAGRAVVEDGEASVLADGVVGRVTQEQVDDVGSVSVGGVDEYLFAPIVA